MLLAPEWQRDTEDVAKTCNITRALAFPCPVTGPCSALVRAPGKSVRTGFRITMSSGMVFDGPWSLASPLIVAVLLGTVWQAQGPAPPRWFRDSLKKKKPRSGMLIVCRHTMAHGLFSPALVPLVPRRRPVHSGTELHMWAPWDKEDVGREDRRCLDPAWLCLCVSAATCGVRWHCKNQCEIDFGRVARNVHVGHMPRPPWLRRTNCPAVMPGGPWCREHGVPCCAGLDREARRLFC